MLQIDDARATMTFDGLKAYVSPGEPVRSIGVLSRYIEGEGVVMRLMLFGQQTAGRGSLPMLSLSVTFPRALTFLCADVVGQEEALRRVEHLCFARKARIAPLTAGDLAALIAVLPLARDGDASTRPVVSLGAGLFV